MKKLKEESFYLHVVDSRFSYLFNVGVDSMKSVAVRREVVEVIPMEGWWECHVCVILNIEIFDPSKNIRNMF